MKRRLRWLFALLLLVVPIFLIIAFVFRDAVREKLVIPVVYLSWLSGMIFNSIPQGYFMDGLVLIGMMLAIGSLRYLLSITRLPTDPPKIVDEPTRYQFWSKRCQKVNTNSFFLTSLGVELRRLVLMVLAYQEHRDMWELERQIVEKDFEVPPVIFELIVQRNLGDEEPEEPGLWQALIERLFGSSQPPDLPGQTLQQRLDQITSFLEYRLEVKHDRRET